jgi:hypothetical protein
MKRAWLPNTTYATPERTQVASIFAFEEVIHLSQGNFLGRPSKRVAATGTRRAVYEMSLRQCGQNLCHHRSWKPALISNIKR